MFNLQKAKENAILYLGFNDIPYLPLFIIVTAAAQPILFEHLSNWEGAIGYLKEFRSAVFFTSITWIIIRYCFIKTNQAFFDTSLDSKTIWFKAIGAAILSFLLGYIISEIFFYFNDTPEIIQSKYDGNWVIGVLTSLVVVGFYEASYAQSRWRRTKLEAERLKKANADSQLQMLKTQVNPHFLFNSLNTLAAIIPENSDTAVKFVEQLSKVYRYILEMSKEQIVTLNAEIACAKAYAFLLQTRYGQNLRINFNHDFDASDVYVAPLSLQMLLENALKHNVASAKNPLTVKVIIDEDKISVHNNLQPRTELEQGTKLGLENIAQRYQLLANLDIETTKTEDSFLVVLPHIKIKHHADTDR